MKGGPGAHAWPTRDRSAAARGRGGGVTTARPERRHGAEAHAERRLHHRHHSPQSRAGPGPAAARPPATPPRTIVAGGISSAQRSWLVRVPFFMSPTHQSYQLLAPTNSWRANAWDGASALSGCIPISLYLSISKHAAR